MAAHTGCKKKLPFMAAFFCCKGNDVLCGMQQKLVHAGTTQLLNHTFLVPAGKFCY